MSADSNNYELTLKRSRRSAARRAVERELRTRVFSHHCGAKPGAPTAI